MARFYKLLAISCWLLAVSCQEGGEAGDLLGQWRQTGSDIHYISFSGSVIWIKDLNQGSVYGNFQHTGDSLFIQCYSAKALPIDTAIVEQSLGFKPFNDIRLKIVTLDSDHLILNKDGHTWNFYKY